MCVPTLPIPMCREHGKSPRLGILVTVSPVDVTTACNHLNPDLTSVERGVSKRARGTHSFEYVIDMTLGSRWELAPTQWVDSTGGAMPGLSVVAYTLHAHSKQHFVDPGLEMSQPVFDGLLDSHPLPCQTSSPASKPPPAAQSGLAYMLEWRDTSTRGACTLLGADRSEAAYIAMTPHLHALLALLAAPPFMASTLPISAVAPPFPAALPTAFGITLYPLTLYPPAPSSPCTSLLASLFHHHSGCHLLPFGRPAMTRISALGATLDAAPDALFDAASFAAAPMIPRLQTLIESRPHVLPAHSSMPAHLFGDPLLPFGQPTTTRVTALGAASDAIFDAY